MADGQNLLTCTKAPSQGPLAGTAVTLNTSNQARPTFQTRDFGPAGVTLGFRVTAHCGGAAVGTDVGTVTIQNTDRPPSVTALASPPEVTANDNVSLTATATDPDGDPIAYAWSQVSNGAPPVVLSAPNLAAVSFQAPAAAGNYTLEFRVVASSRALSDVDIVLVNVTAVNLAPFASLQCPVTINEGAPLRLDGSGSRDPEAGVLTYAWSVDKTDAGLDFDLGGQAGTVVERTTPALGLHMAGGVEVTLRVTDDRGNYTDAICAFMIKDVTAPLLSLPAPATLDAQTAAGTRVPSYAVSAVDNVEGYIGPASIACTPPAPHLFPLGLTTVPCSIGDTAGNRSSGSFQITVQDLSPPILAVHSDVAVQADGPNGSFVTYVNPTATDLVDANVEVTCDPPSGSRFAIGTKEVTCTATDDARRTALTTFNVTVHDTLPPVITVPAPITTEATFPQGAPVSFSVSALDVVNGAVPVTCLPTSGSTFPVGTTTVNCSARDLALPINNVGTKSFNITVTDTSPPVLPLPFDIVKEATSGSGARVTFALPPATSSTAAAPSPAHPLRAALSR